MSGFKTGVISYLSIAKFAEFSDIKLDYDQLMNLSIKYRHVTFEGADKKSRLFSADIIKLASGVDVNDV